MGKCLLSLKDLFPTLLTTTLLLLIYAQPIYGQQSTILILDENEVNTLLAVFTGLNQRPFPKINKFICMHKYSSAIDCNCGVNQPELICDPPVHYKEKPKDINYTICYNNYGKFTTCYNCRNYTTCYVRSIFLSGQQLDGKILPGFENLTYLENLDFSSNYLKGSIPKELGLLQKLKKLILYRNFLNGSIPKELGAMSSLLVMDLGANRLSGNIPKELGNITSLRYLSLTSNLLDGKVTPLKNLKELRTLALADNAFNGPLHETLFYNLINMEDFDVMGNSFSGPIQNIYRWKRLSRFNLLGNKFEGPLDAISYSKSLVFLMISDMNGNTGKGISFPDISKLENLTTLILRNCSINGPIDADHIGTLTNLRNIDLSFNNLTGDLPKNIIYLPLDSIYLTRNNFSGPIPDWGEPTRRKMNADFSHNNFSEVSFSYSEDDLSHLNLYACCNPTTSKLKFEWEKSNFACPTKSKNTQLFINCGGGETRVNDNNYEADFLKNGASTIHVSKNNTWAYSTTGKFLGTVVGSTESTYVQKTSCLAIDDSPLYMDARISPMSLKYYGLCLKEDDYTVKLYFNEIVFTNATNYGVNAKRVFDVFIQGNHVLQSFDITKEANGTRKSLVKTFNASVGNNGLEIHFYWGGQGSIYIPPGLYGPLVSAISVTPVQKPQKKPLSTGQIVGIAGSTFFVMVLILVFLQKMGWLGKKLSNSDSMAHGGIFDIQQLKDATQNFHLDNKIGEGKFGRVYKGELVQGGKSVLEIAGKQPVSNSKEGKQKSALDMNVQDKLVQGGKSVLEIAVKQPVSNSKEGKQMFKNELDIAADLDHPNVVKLLGRCLENNQLLLVYEYMENNSLYTAFFGAGNSKLKSRLDWQARLKICIGIAKGLAYLHEESNETKSKIIHANIKPTNILLDKDLNAKLSGFGLARTHEEKHALSTKVGGTSCYVAPEYAMHGFLTYKSDVYNFGVVMLEILSGKSSIDCTQNDETAYLLDRAYKLEENGRLSDLLDRGLKMDYDVIRQVEMALNLAMLCTKQTPAVRPKMSDVVSILEGKTDLETVLKGPKVVPSDSDDSFWKASLRKTKSSSFFSSGTSMQEKVDRPVQNLLHDDISDENAGELKKQI